MSSIKPMKVIDSDVPKLQAIKDACPQCGTNLVERSRGGWLSCRQCRAMWKEDTTLR